MQVINIIIDIVNINIIFIDIIFSNRLLSILDLKYLLFY